MTPPSPIRIFALGLARERPPDSDLFFFNDTATTEIYTLSLHDALPICHADVLHVVDADVHHLHHTHVLHVGHADRKSTRLNSSHLVISYAVFCLKKIRNSKSRLISALVRSAPAVRTITPMRSGTSRTCA